MNNLQTEQNRSIFKRALHTPVTLILGIMLAVTGILTIAYFGEFDCEFSELTEALSWSFCTLFPNDSSSAKDLYEAASAIVVLCTTIVPLLSFVGYLLTFIGSGNSPTKSPKGGTVVLIVSSILSLIGFTFILFMYLSSMETFAEAFEYRYAKDEAVSLFIRVTFLVVAYILYGISNLVLSCSMTGMCNGTKRSGSSSVLFGVSSILIAFIYFAYVLDYTSENDRLSDLENMFVAALVFSAISYILSAVFAFIFKGRINVQPVPAYAYTSVPAASVAETPVYANYETPYAANLAPTPYPAYTPEAHTQKFPVAAQQEAVAVRTAIREAEDIPTENSGNTPAFCAQCGTPIKPEQIFCANCGAKLK